MTEPKNDQGVWIDGGAGANEPRSHVSDMTVTSGFASSEGADIYYEYAGEGPILLMIPGSGDAGTFTAVRPYLEQDYTVVSFDRRGRSRSGGRVEEEMSVAQQSRDAATVINAMGAERALVFGTSGGAITTLDMVAHCPESVVAAIVHEPPAVRVMPDSNHWLNYFDEIHELSRTDLEAAGKKFKNSVAEVGFTPYPPDTLARIKGGQQYAMTRELLSFVRYQPDIGQIRANNTSVIMAAGSGSIGHYYATTAEVLARQLACPYVLFPGYHRPYMDVTEDFSVKLLETLAGYREHASRSAGSVKDSVLSGRSHIG